MKLVTSITAILFLSVLAQSITGRLIKDWPYDELFNKSDFVVIAKAATATHDTSEHTTLPDGQIKVVGVVTEFEILLMLKGGKRERFVLHHYRLDESDGVAILNGPSFVTFDPAKNDHPYLLFLVREPDGRFAPSGGQTDPLNISVQTLSGF
jgi:hypothetical protein